MTDVPAIFLLNPPVRVSLAKIFIPPQGTVRGGYSSSLPSHLGYSKKLSCDRWLAEIRWSEISWRYWVRERRRDRQGSTQWEIDKVQDGWGFGMHTWHPHSLGRVWVPFHTFQNYYSPRSQYWRVIATCATCMHSKWEQNKRRWAKSWRLACLVVLYRDLHPNWTHTKNPNNSV